MDERIFWLCVFLFPLLLVHSLRMTGADSHTTKAANIAVDFFSACSLPAWRLLLLPSVGVCPDLGGGSAGSAAGRTADDAMFRPPDGAVLRRCWERPGDEALVMAIVGGALFVPCWVGALIFSSRGETLWHGAGRRVYQSDVRLFGSRLSTPAIPAAQEKPQPEPEPLPAGEDSAHPLDRCETDRHKTRLPCANRCRL